ncbi:unnamed protein product [Rotaria sordida]|uniref:Uncharacterized protein n=1 Tax=Rotaria sordida TaxID=392033 RepID=A0A814GN30_9BILA|nr:unnamed protein product [Rotaria sordida]CAF1101902.1 unnamed protein product [Rotaria sordida]CAF1109440.1 unnamed protein product [Rotaria sordida]CAF3908234.1 unnamed protein product [Rotaria sordida]CAF3927284.1 unnamed protein product [Rotaria sordida]
MRLSNISIAPYRAQMIPMNQGDFQSKQFANRFTSSSVSSINKWYHQHQNRISPEFDTSWAYNQKLQKNNDNKNKNNRKTCFWIGIAVLISFLIACAIIGIVLGLTLSSSSKTTSSTTLLSSTSTINSTNSTSSTSTTTTTTTVAISIACSNTGRGVLAFQNQTTPTAWTSYSRTFTSTSASHTILFGFQTDGTNSFYLDTVSVVDSTLSSPQLLTNPNFENSTTTPTGWTVSCEATTCGLSAANIANSSQCSSGYCFESFCTSGRTALIFLSQTFATTSGNLHTVTYMLKRTNIGSSGFMAFYLDVI